MVVFFSEHILGLRIFLSTQLSGRVAAEKRFKSPYSDMSIDHNGGIDLLPPNFKNINYLAISLMSLHVFNVT